MKHYIISNLLNNSTVFGTKNSNQVNDLLSGQYSADKNIRFKISVLRSNLCNSNAYIVVKGRTIVTGTNTAKRRNK